MVDVYNMMWLLYCNHLSVKVASENSSKHEFKTLHHLLQFLCAKVNNNTKTESG